VKKIRDGEDNGRIHGGVEVTDVAPAQGNHLRVMLDCLKLFDAYRVDDWFLFEPYTRELGMWDILAVKSNEKT
jgi:hypothetical protein